MEKSLVHPGEKEHQERLFQKMPVRAILSFLDCFDEDGSQTFEVPEHVMQFLVTRLRAFMDKDSSSLNHAFGTKVATQRNKILKEELIDEVVFYLRHFLEEIKFERQSQNSSQEPGTPMENAYEKTANVMDLGVETVRVLYKESKLG